jgi:hypothetical protein
LYKYNDSSCKEKHFKHPLYNLLHYEPNPEMTSFAFRATLPASALIGQWNGGTTAASVIVAVVFFWLARRFRKFALANYTGASS